MKKFLFVVLGFFAVLSLPSFSHAEEDKSKVAEAADAVIAGLPGALKAGVDFSKMKPEDRVNWLLNNVEAKVEETVADKFKDAIKSKVEAYAKEAIRAKAFMEIGVPQIRNAYAMGQAFDWSKMDAEIASNADTKFRALGAGLKTAQVSWATIQAYRQGDLSAAARTLGGELAGLLAEAYIPGYGYIKVGAAMVELLGNYVLDYATDTAVEGMLNSMYDMKSNPQGLAKWLIDKSPSDISRDINQKFDDGMAFGYLFRGQGTDKADEEMKSRIHGELMSLRSQLVTQMKEQERREKQAQDAIEQYLQKYREAEKALKEEAAKAKAEADAQLQPIEQFRKQVTPLRKQDVKENISDIQSQQGEIGSSASVPYVAFNYTGLLSELAGVYSEIKDTPSGYDYDATTRMWSAYYKNRAEALKKVGEENQQNCRAAMKQVEDQYQPRFRSLWGQIENAKDGRTKDALYAQYNALRNEYSAAQGQKSAGCAANNKRLSIEIATFKEEEELVKLEAQERADKLSASIRQGVEKIIDDLKRIRREKDEAMKAWIQEVQQTLAYPDFFLSPGSYDQARSGSSVSGTARTIKEGKLQVYQPGDLHSSREQVLEAIEAIKKDQPLLAGLSEKHKQILVNFQTQIVNLKGQFESLVPENLRGAGASRTKEAEEYQRSEDDRVAQYGSAAASMETWVIAHPPLVRFRDLPRFPEVENSRYFDKVLAENDVLAKARQEKFKAALKDWEAELQTVDFYADLDRIAVSIMSLNDNINAVLGGFIGAYPNFRVKDGKESLSVPAEDSDGAKILENMKKAWDSAKPYVERMRKNVNAYGKGIKYLAMGKSPQDAIKRLPYYEGIPAQITAHEKRMAESETQRLQSLKLVDNELAKLSADIESLKDPEKWAFYTTTLRQLRAMFDQIFRIAKVDRTRSEFKEKYEALHTLMEKYVKEHDAEVKKRNEEYKRKAEADAQSAAQAARQRQERENAAMVRETNPLLYYGYQLMDPRINSYSAANMSGEIVVTRDKLVNGTIELTARLNHIDQAKTMLVSEDGGRTWKEITLSTDVRYAFSPIPNKQYQPVLKIKTKDMVDVTMAFLNGGSIVYQAGDFSQEVLKAVQNIADAYERQDFGSFSNMVSRDFLGNKASLDEGVRFDFDMFTDIRLIIYVDRINQRGDSFTAETRWDKSQAPRKTGEVQKTSGKTTMAFVMEDGQLKLRNLRGNLLYATLSPDIAQSSGLKSTIVDQVRTAQQERKPIQPGSGTTLDDGGVTEERTLTVTSPNGGEVWAQESMQNITWTSTGVDFVKIEVSEGGAEGMWFDVVASTSAAARTYSWSVWPVSSVSRVRITDVDDETVTDMSDADFTVP